MNSTLERPFYQSLLIPGYHCVHTSCIDFCYRWIDGDIWRSILGAEWLVR